MSMQNIINSRDPLEVKSLNPVPEPLDQRNSIDRFIGDHWPTIGLEQKYDLSRFLLSKLQDETLITMEHLRCEIAEKEARLAFLKHELESIQSILVQPKPSS